MKGLNTKIEQAKDLLESLSNTDITTINELKDILIDIKKGNFYDSSLFENSILNDLKYGIWSVSIDFMHLFYVNPSFIKITKYSKIELQDNPKLIKEIIHPED